ncbi:MAG: hypothetical protein H0U28_12850 [Nocardioidaceae bacterium]|nr:hypothetical protein [Nocardioidaceae bacterium]
MGLLDKARAAATDLAAKADTARVKPGAGGSGSGGDADRYFRDLGVLAYLEANGRSTSLEDRERVMDALKGMETQGTIGTFMLQTSVPPPPGGTVPPPPPQAQTPPPAQSAPSAPAPPPPSWMTKDDDKNN